MLSVSQRERGQVLVIFALSVVAILTMMAVVFDVGNQLIQRRVAQNAADAGALAGVQALALPNSTPATVYNTIMTFVEGNSGPWTQTTTTTSSCATPMPDVCVTKLSFLASDNSETPIDKNVAAFGAIRPVGILVEVTRTVPSTFAQLVGIKTLTASGRAGASAGNGPADIILAFDTTGSMGAHMADERLAASKFITMMAITTDVNSVHVGLVRFQGTHNNGTWVDHGHDGGHCCDNNGNRIYQNLPADLVTNGTIADYDWVPDGLPQVTDATVLARLSSDPVPLQSLVAGGGTCPSLPSPNSLDGDWKMGPTSTYACSLKYVNYNTTAPNGKTMEMGGTRLPNAFDLVLGNAGNGGFNAWSSTYGGRPYTRNIMIMMTDGQDNCQCGSSSTTTDKAWDDLARTDAISIRKGADGTAGTDDDVEIYTVGYFGSGESGIATGTYPAGSVQYSCPGPDWVGVTPAAVQTVGETPYKYTAQPIDILLHDISSSTPGTCDHYMPITKSDDLGIVFQTLAGKVRAGRLSN